MLRICIYVIWQLYLILVDEFFWSFIAVLLAGVVFAGILQRLLVFPQFEANQTAQSPVRQLQSLSVPKPRWGKAFSYNSQDVLSSSSDSDSADPHELIERCWPTEEEDEIQTGSPRRGIRDSRDLRRTKWRNRQFARAPLDLNSVPAFDKDIYGSESEDLLKSHNTNGSISDRPRLQRQEPVGSQSNNAFSSPVRIDRQSIDVTAEVREEPNKNESSPVLSDRAVPSDFSTSLAEETNEPLYPSTSLINPVAGPVCGSVEVSFFYEAIEKTLFVTVIQANNLDSVAHAGLQIKLCLLPSKRLRFKTKPRHGKAPKFYECFHLKGLSSEDINSMGLRIRLYMYEKLVRGQLIGECVVGFGSINLDVDSTLWLTLEPKKAVLFHTSMNGGELRSISRSDSTLSAQSMPLSSSSPELLLGLSFNDITGHLKVEIAKGSRFRSPSVNRPVDTFVKLSLLSSNAQEISRAKTSVRRAQPNPVFRESFLFPVALFQLSDVTLVCSVYIRRSMKRKQLLGWLAMGHNNSSRECSLHWRDFQETHDQIWRWHTLVRC